ncbi:TlpA family protein disulfide reductase [Balneola sp. MJW-20]|uniref:TlpA family protein disulfide reductase n=1 Tax=Gracilimonas aurantiaca TaxID=3234185 RepID=UPI00346731A5
MKNRNIGSIYLSTFLFLIILSFASCSDTGQKISGNIDYIGNSNLIVEYPKLHYKYSQTVQDTLKIDAEGNFSFNLRNTSAGNPSILIQDRSYPLFIPGNDLEINIIRSDFPQSVSVEGYEKNWDEKYDLYLKAVEGMDELIEAEVEKMKVGKANDVIQLAQEKIHIAREHLSDTPFSYMIDKVSGEYLVLRIRSVEYNDRNFPDFNTDSVRTAVVEEASGSGFFGFESLKAQRAGIRDFSHYYSRTFGIYDSVESAEGQELSEYDIKRLAFKELNLKKEELLPYITERDARAYAELFYLAERIGEQPLDSTEKYYSYYLSEYESYTDYIRFITEFYDRMKKVSPGNPAIPFELPDRQGEIHRMADYEGKYVLLDFWAGWCQPCLDEFPAMRNLYEKYPRADFEILGISNEVDSLQWIRDIEQFENPWPQFYGGKGFEEETFKAYQGGGIPFYILIGPDGNILRYNDIRPTFNLETILDSLITD